MTPRMRLDLPSVAKLAALADVNLPFAARTASSLGVYAAMAAGSRTLDELATATGCHDGSLLRLLRALVFAGALAEPEEGSFELTGLGQVLARGLGDARGLCRDEIRALAALGRVVHGEPVPSFADTTPAVWATIDRWTLAAAALAIPAIAPGAVVREWPTGGGWLAAHAGPLGIVAWREEADLAADRHLLRRPFVGRSRAEGIDLLGAARAEAGLDAALVVLEPVWHQDSPLMAMIDLHLLTTGTGEVATAAELASRWREAGLAVAGAVGLQPWSVFVLTPV
jgi:hypothetical protein